MPVKKRNTKTNSLNLQDREKRLKKKLASQIWTGRKEKQKNSSAWKNSSSKERKLKREIVWLN